MNKDKFYIDMPDEITIKTQIENIVSKGVRPEESFWSCLKDMYKHIGLRYLFYDTVEIIFSSLVVFSVLIFLVATGNIYETVKDEDIYAFLFAVVPIIYLTISLLAFVKAEQNGTYELEMTCKYDMYQKAAFRMLVFSVLCILFNSVLVYIITVINGQISFLRAFMISVTSLFLFSAIFLTLINRFCLRWTKYFVIIGWVLFNMALRILVLETFIKLLNDVSIYIWFGVTAICIYGYIKNLKKLLNHKFRSIKGVI